MKCPKCSYVGYEATDRCRHCGYDFSLTPVAPESLAVTAPRMAAVPLPSIAAVSDVFLAPPPAGPPVPSEDELPLQAAPRPSGAEAFSAPPPPAGTPLAVRRTTERIRVRSTTPVRRPRPALLDVAAADVEAATPAAAAAPTPEVSAPPVARLLSAALDAVLLLGIDASVVYFTAKIANVPLADVPTLPLAPLATFLLGLNIAYLAVFTANGGQTLGKMAAGLRVEGTDGPVTFGDASVRVVVALVGALAVGAGFLPALWRHDRRAVHDQIAHTRVVKVLA